MSLLCYISLYKVHMYGKLLNYIFYGFDFTTSWIVTKGSAANKK